MSVATTTVQDRFSAEARNWDRLYDAERPGSIYEHNLVERRRTALEYVGEPTGRVLDVGCGPGNVTLALPDGVPVVATDFALPMLKEAQRSATSLRKPLDLTASDAANLPYAGNSIDTVIALGLLEYIPDPSDVLEEITRVLNSEGTLVLSSPNADSPFIRIDDALKAVKNAVTRILLPAPVRRGLKRMLGRSDKDYFTHKRHRFAADHIYSELDRLGFDVVARRYHTFGFGVLNRLRINLSLCRKMETWATTHPNLEKLGWTIVLKAKKRS